MWFSGNGKDNETKRRKTMRRFRHVLHPGMKQPAARPTFFPASPSWWGCSRLSHRVSRYGAFPRGPKPGCPIRNECTEAADHSLDGNFFPQGMGLWPSQTSLTSAVVLFTSPGSHQCTAMYFDLIIRGYKWNHFTIIYGCIATVLSAKSMFVYTILFAWNGFSSSFSDLKAAHLSVPITHELFWDASSPTSSRFLNDYRTKSTGRHRGEVIGKACFKIKRSRFQFHLCHLLVIWLWARDLTSLSLGLFIWKWNHSN